MKKILTILLLISINLYSLTKDEENFLYASEIGDINKVKELLALGVNINIQNEEGETALMWALQYANVQLVRELIKSGANVNIKDKYGNTALDYAKDEGHNDIVELLSK